MTAIKPLPNVSSGRSRRRRRPLLWLLAVVAVVVTGAGWGVLGLLRQGIAAPGWVLARVEERVNTALDRGQDRPSRIELGGGTLRLDANGAPRLMFTDVRLLSGQRDEIANLPAVAVQLNRAALLRGEIQPVDLLVTGAEITVRRDQNGRLDFDFRRAPDAGEPDAGGPAPADAGPAAAVTDPMVVVTRLLTAVDTAFRAPLLARIRRIDATGLTVVLRDARAHRVLRATGGRIEFVQSDDDLSLAVDLGRLQDQPGLPSDAPAQARMTVSLVKGTTAARVSAELENVPAADFAAQLAGLAWLSAVQTRVTARIDGAFDVAGAVGMIDGNLALSAGVVQPIPATLPIPFDSAALTFSYDPAAGRVSFADLSLVSDAVLMQGDGLLYLENLRAGMPRTMLAQLSLRQVTLDPDGIFAAPVRFGSGAVDVRLALDPFRVTIGQAVLIDAAADGERRIDATGHVAATPKGWEVALDLALDRIAHDRLLALWPLAAVPLTRDWVEANVETAELFNVNAALRLPPGEPLRLSLGFEYRDADVRYIRTLPSIRESTGHATLEGDSFVLAVAKGQVTPPQGGVIEAGGTVLRIHDIRAKPAPATLDLRADSSITAALALLDEPPFGFVTKAGQPVDVAEGRVAVSGGVNFVLARKLEPGDVTYRVRGDLRDVSSDRLVPDRTLRADALTLTATEAGLEVAGAGTLDGVPLTAVFNDPFAETPLGGSTLTGSVELSQRFVDTFDIGLPDGAVGGEGQGQFVLAITPRAATTFRLISDLAGLSLGLPQIGWAKPAATTGSLAVAGSFGPPPRIDRLTLDAPGLRASGAVTITADGGLEAARFDRVQAGNWLDAPVVLTGRGPDAAVAISIQGGSLDLRQTDFADAPENGGETGPVDVRLDRLIVSEGIAITGVTAKLGSGSGFGGSFSGKVNGGPAVTGTLTDTPAGTAVRVDAADGGGVIAAARIFPQARGGDLALVLTPTGANGVYDGQLRVTNTRVRDAPVLAELLGAISVVGLIEQLDGEGLVFNDVQASFRLTPTAVEVRSGSAVGASLGVSMSGVYALATGRLQFQGVISPIYLLNGIGAFLTRRGEGLFGFNYDLTGTADAPRVSVNPLSILTPGMFREIFRIPAPRAAP